MKLGSEDKKKVYALGVLGAVALYAVWSSFFSGPSVPSASSTSALKQRAAATAAPGGPVRRAPRVTAEDWHPKLHSKSPDEQIDAPNVDPTLHLDRLAKLQDVPAAGSGRNLFSMSQPPPPELPKHPEPIVAVNRMNGPPPIPPPAPPPGPPPPPPMPPVTFKYYGIATVRSDGSQTAFFLDGENNIIIKSVGETVEGSYKLVRIGSNSAIVEDTKSKRQQTVPLAEEAVQG